MLKRLLAPFAGDSRFWWGWVIFLGLAPAAYWGGLRLDVPQAGETQISSAQAIGRAMGFGKSLGVNLRDWKPSVHLNVGAEHAILAATSNWQELPATRRALAPINTIRVLFASPDKKKWFAVWLRPDGQVHGFDTSPNLLAVGEAKPETESRQLALAEAERAFPDQRWGQPEVETGIGSGTQGARRYLWRTPVLPGVESTLSVEVQGSRITERTLAVKVNRGELPVRESRFNAFFSSLAALGLAIGVVYAVYRFSRRALEREISWTRSGIMVGTMALFGGLVILLDISVGAGSLSPDQSLSPFAMLLPVSVVLSFALQGIVLALVYGAGEGEMRESYPGKITSFDAVFTGYLTSANVGRSLVIGAAAGGWAFLAARLLHYAAGHSLLRETTLSSAYGRSPWVITMISEPVTAFFLACLCLMLPLLYLGRHLERSWLRRLLAVVFCLLGAITSGFGVNFDEPATIGTLVVIAALALLTFWFGDFLGAVVGLWWFFAFMQNNDLSAVVDGWAANAQRTYALGIVSALLGVVMLYRGRKLSDAEVRPQHAHRIEERLSLEQEVSAAREAQIRLLPDSLPEIDGFGLAASCHPAREVGGDFYDFYRLPRQRHGVLVADGSSGGLASALTIGLAKGFLSYAAQRDWPAGLALERLKPVLTQAISSTAHHFSLCYAVLDTARGELRYARLGQNPRLFHLSHRQRQGPGRMVAEVTPPPEGDEGRLQLDPGDLFLFCTDGLTARLESRMGCTLDAWLDGLNDEQSKTAERFHADLLQTVNATGADLKDDITAVIIEMQVPQLKAGAGVELRGVA